MKNNFDLDNRLVIIPTYNEKENIQKIIKAVMSLDVNFDVLVVDDGSPDGTAKLVMEMQSVFPGRVNLLERKGKSGLGTAYIDGFRWGLQRHYQYFFEMDADFSHNPQDLPALYRACMDQGDVSVGSRYVKGGRVQNWPIDRILLSYGASLYTRAITWMPVKDPTAGFVCYKRRVLEEMDLDKIRFVGYAFQIEMKFAAMTLGFKIVEVPITFVDRVEGTSKMSLKIIREAILGVLQMRFKSLFRSYKFAGAIK